MTSIQMITQDVSIDRRIVLEARTLIEAGYDVTILGCADVDANCALNLPTQCDESIDGVQVQRIMTYRQDRRYRWVYRLSDWAGRRSRRYAMIGITLLNAVRNRDTFSRIALGYVIQTKADIYTAHDLNNLQTAHQAAKVNRSRLVYDAHELFTEISNPWVKMKKRYWSKVEGSLLPRCDAASTVNEFIAEEMGRRYKVKPPVVIYNATNPPADFDPAQPPDYIRTDLGIGKERRIALYQGWMAKGRGLDKLVLAGKYVPDNIAIVLMGFGEYRTVLERLVAEAGLQHKVYFHEAVPQSRLVEYSASADVGLIPYQAVDLNNYYCSPNKLFDYIVAGLPIIANDLPFLHKMIATNGLGLDGQMDTPEQIAGLISRLLGDEALLAATRSHLLQAAKVYNWTEEGKKLVAMYEQVRQKAGR